MRRELGEVDIKRDNFQGDSLSPLVFVLMLIPLSLILRKAKAAHEFSGSKENISSFIEVKLFPSCSLVFARGLLLFCSLLVTFCWLLVTFAGCSLLFAGCSLLFAGCSLLFPCCLARNSEGFFFE